MRRSYEDHRRPSPRRPTASVREAAVLVRHFMSATMTIPPTISIRVLPSRRQLEVVEAICTLTASQPASHNIGARSPRERTPICFRSLIKTIMLASHGCKPTRRHSEAARHKAHSSASANLPASSFNPASMRSATVRTKCCAADLTEASRFPDRRVSDSTCWLGGGQQEMAKPYSQDLRDRVIDAVK